MISSPLNTPLYGGSTLSATVPRPYQVAINGVPFLINFQFLAFQRESFRHRSLPLLRAQADIGGSGISTLNNLPAEASLNPDGLWRRSQDNFWFGSGQLFLDRKDSNPEQYRSSKGINPWTHWQMTLQNATASIRSSVNTNLQVLVVGNYLYVVDGGHVLWTTTTTGTPTFTTVFSGSPVSSIATDGYNVWFAVGGQGVYTTTAGSSAAATQLVTSGLNANAIVAYVKGRLMVANGPAVYNVTSTTPAALPAALMTQANPQFRWVAFAEGQNQIYMAGFAGTASLIYGTAVVADGTTLSAPIIYGQLPVGETVTAMFGYLGFLVIGTSLGVRLGTLETSGVIILGALILIPAAVQCFAASGRWVWFGWSNYDTSSTGLGRLDLVNFSQPNTPAFASDLMAAGQGAVTGVAVLNGTVVFAVAAEGLFAQQATYVSSGTWQSGLITYDVADLKEAVFLDLQFAPAIAGTSITTAISLDGGAFQPAGAVSAASDTGRQTFATDQGPASTFEVQLTLSTTTPANTPVLYRHTLRSLIAAPSVTEIILPLLTETVLNVGDANLIPQLPSGLRGYLESLRQQRRIVTLQEGDQTYTVTIEALDFLPDHPSGFIPGEFEGTTVVTFHTVS